MSNPYFDLQEETATRLALHATLAHIPMVTEEKGDIEKRIQVSLTKGGINQSAALAVLADPAAIVFAGGGAELADSPGAMICNGEGYTYAISHQTDEGETALSETTVYASANESDKALRIPLVTPPERVTAIRIWRNRVDGGETLSLLVEVEPDATEYQDAETHAQFSGRIDAGIDPPEANTTAVLSKAGLAFLIFTPQGRNAIGRGTGAASSRTILSQFITVRVALFCKPLINDGASGHQIAPLEAHWAAQLQMLSWNRGPGQPPIMLDVWDSEETNNEISYYNDFSVPLMLNTQ